jgi:hypothetical protein
LEMDRDDSDERAMAMAVLSARLQLVDQCLTAGDAAGATIAVKAALQVCGIEGATVAAAAAPAPAPTAAVAESADPAVTLWLGGIPTSIAEDEPALRGVLAQAGISGVATCTIRLKTNEPNGSWALLTFRTGQEMERASKISVVTGGHDLCLRRLDLGRAFRSRGRLRSIYNAHELTLQNSVRREQLRTQKLGRLIREARSAGVEEELLHGVENTEQLIELILSSDPKPTATSKPKTLLRTGKVLSKDYGQPTPAVDPSRLNRVRSASAVFQDQTLWVGNIPEACATEDSVVEAMCAAGARGIRKCTVRVKPGKRNGSWALVSFKDAQCLHDAAKLTPVMKDDTETSEDGDDGVTLLRIETPAKRPGFSDTSKSLMQGQSSYGKAAYLVHSSVLVESGPEPTTGAGSEPGSSGQQQQQPAVQGTMQRALEYSLWVGNIPLQLTTSARLKQALAAAGYNVEECTIREKSHKERGSWGFVSFKDAQAYQRASSSSTLRVALRSVGSSPHSDSETVELEVKPLGSQLSSSSSQTAAGSDEPGLVSRSLLVAHALSIQARLTRSVESLQLPPNKRYHFFLSHHQNSGGDQCHIIYKELTRRGYLVWYDNGQKATARNLNGMRQGVADSVCLLLFLSGRRETDGQPDKDGQYEGPFTRWFCHEELTAAHENQLRMIGVMETEDHKGKPDLFKERERALHGGARQGTEPMPVHPDAEFNLHLLNDVCFLPFRRQEHEMHAMMNEIERQLFSGYVLPPRPAPTTVNSVRGLYGDRSLAICDASELRRTRARSLTSSASPRDMVARLKSS